MFQQEVDVFIAHRDQLTVPFVGIPLAKHLVADAERNGLLAQQCVQLLVVHSAKVGIICWRDTASG